MSVIIPVKDVFFVRLSDENDDAEDDVDECRKTDEDHRQSEPVSISSAANVKVGLMLTVALNELINDLLMND